MLSMKEKRTNVESGGVRVGVEMRGRQTVQEMDIHISKDSGFVGFMWQ
jgi:hypothetical protein